MQTYIMQTYIMQIIEAKLQFWLKNNIKSIQGPTSKFCLLLKWHPKVTMIKSFQMTSVDLSAAAPMYYKGVYHFFYQHNPYAPTFGEKMVWAHSVSYDLINWIHLNHAIEPSDSYDINSCWSGSATIIDKT